MPLKLDGFEIEDRYLTSLKDRGDTIVTFRGRALEEKGKEICEELSKFKKSDMIEVLAVNASNSLWREGIYEIMELKIIPPPLDRAPAIYRFSGLLAPVY